ncbi:uncharacterized mitochondrial protein AtMg00810-like [Lycium barbarum]|uniref:uncharacterized mitochondrial protein AtMg00810-like n=1 Tax=Lycium barbarum TaxID=112863 RepID=UPI00293E531B|nr:uncharacterized mitochondrial protein AtMg00810-like [Lycium barbarum]
MLLTSESLELIAENKNSLQEAFKMKDLGELKYFPGIEFARSEKGILLHHKKYALELVSESGLSASKPAITPMEANCKLTTIEYDKTVKKLNKEKGIKHEGTQDRLLEDQSIYQRLIRNLLYLTVTRPDIAYTV